MYVCCLWFLVVDVCNVCFVVKNEECDSGVDVLIGVLRVR